MNDETRNLAHKLGISDKQLAGLERKYENDLESVLAKWWNEMRERPRLLGRQGEYTTSPFAALYTSEPEDSRRHPEPEAVTEAEQKDISDLAEKRWEIYMRNERAEEVAKQELRSVTQALREVSLMAVRNGIDPGPLLESIKAQIAAQAQENERKAA